MAKTFAAVITKRAENDWTITGFECPGSRGVCVYDRTDRTTLEEMVEWLDASAKVYGWTITSLKYCLFAPGGSKWTTLRPTLR